ncbi:hypothetical protein RFI_33728 [Reticulomyxa filosa]|uniref:Uncharacterized protein n=1 Tax=Reticulomyxa filosa TaxID=46433 RepID=X6LPW3_RETFI|nr:hypothetical protein RFI_33728 [Reticulomyxa filosa]|eukprot:ETO03674.1 hypothetical protein RFI_33728 [Reticulomyxa filosa]
MENLSFEQVDYILFEVRSNDRSDLCLYAKHIAPLWHQLNERVKTETTNDNTIEECVLPAYQSPLTDDLKTQLDLFVQKTPLAIVKTILNKWREVARKEGQKQEIEKQLFADWLDNVYFYDNEMVEFPKALQWKYCSTAYAYVFEIVHKKTNIN